ncbi:hypothetical protein BGZ61DRAFT_589439 [Ilyonectria robusta]|uniref:uncharacterized protein n=1 Tax=Ilyonectria robusta TaxID=1079257 RepID=UPI001E8EAB5B|nr:uncharacterized protein BGZ61DRAFT_589439 [Ilyonectria robusta]KAH8687092.1 hypothetical protein BGZ61DRAFT_589439 [Ilyonectria robusta]
MFKTALRIKWAAWGLEYWAILGSVASFVAMVVLLHIFDGKVVFTWNSVTLNTIVSILSLTIKATLAYVLAECMAQWKWILFAREARSLMDFERIDAATRGPLGSLRVLIRTRGAPYLQFGAILTLLAIGLDPLAQQLVQLQQSVVFERHGYDDPNNVALISQAPSYSMGKMTVTEEQLLNSSYSNWSIETEIPLSMQSAIFTGLSRSLWEVEREPLVQCPTGNCTWGQFNTLGVCHKCNNITSDLKRMDGFGDVLVALTGSHFTATIPSTAFYLPNGHFIANIDGCPPYDGANAECDGKQPLVIYYDEGYAVTSFGTGNPNKTNSMKDIDTLIWSMSVIYPEVELLNVSTSQAASDERESIKWPNVPMRAMECAIHYCVKTVDSSVNGNQLIEEISEATDFIRDPDSWERSPEPDNNLPENIPPDDEVDSLEFDSRYSVASYSSLVLKSPDNNTAPWYRVDQVSVKSLSAHFQSLFKTNFQRPTGLNNTDASEIKKELEKKLGKGAVGFNGVSLGPDSLDLSMKATPPALNGVWAWKRTNMTRAFNTLAISMTNKMRRNYEPGAESNSGQDTDRFQDGTMTQFGNVGSLTVVYDIQWAWISLHGVMLLSVIVFLCMTLISSASAADVPLWKSSSLATMRRGYEAGDVLDGAETVEDMENTARKAYVKVPRRDVDEGAPFRRSSNDAAS